MAEQHYSLNDLLHLMSRLRAPQGGCPWDLEQNFHSIVPSTIEELYEVVELIEAERFDELPDELGDLLFQIVFYAQLGREQGLFNFDDVIDAITRKLLRRHPHVFVDGDLYGAVRQGPAPEKSVLGEQWQQIKAAEKAQRSEQPNPPVAPLWGDLPAGLPALAAAQKISAQAARLGFDWPTVAGPVAKVSEELNELKAEIDLASRPAIEEEYGDLLLAVVNLGRHINIDAEQALRTANNKFRRRFGAMLDLHSEPFNALSGDDWDLLWEQVKAAE